VLDEPAHRGTRKAQRRFPKSEAAAHDLSVAAIGAEYVPARLVELLRLAVLTLDGAIPRPKNIASSYH
jgi:hypothetical protein